MGLSAAEIAQWNRDGYVICRGALRPEDLAPMVSDYEHIVDELAKRLYAEGRISRTYEDEPFDSRYARICEDDPTVSPDHLDNYLDIGHATARGQSRGTFELMKCPRLMALIAPILGTEEIGWSPISHVRAKLPATAEALQTGDGLSNVAAFHQDAIFVTEDADEVFILTVWLPITEATVEMGCLELMPSVHTHRKVYWAGSSGSMGDSLPRLPTYHEPVSPGDVVLLHKLCPHGSGPNLSSKVRWSMDMRYMRAGLPSGRDCWPTFVAQSKQNPENETCYGDWSKQWQDALVAYPQRVGRSEGFNYRGAVPYIGPMGWVDPSLALPSSKCTAVRAAAQQRGPAATCLDESASRAKF